jgi:diacylglycerol kinase (ATP)
MSKPGNTGLRRIVNATFYSFAGVRTVWRSEAAFRQECALAIVLIPLACWLGANAVERSLLIGTCLLVLIVELLNTAVEYVVDRIGPERHALSAGAKDAGSAAVLLSLLLTLVVWALIAWQRFAPP